MTAPTDKLNGLHFKLAEVMEDILTNGEIVKVKGEEGESEAIRVTPSPATLNAVRQFLKDNHIEAGVVPPKSPLARLAERLPFAAVAAQEEEDDRVASYRN